MKPHPDSPSQKPQESGIRIYEAPDSKDILDQRKKVAARIKEAVTPQDHHMDDGWDSNDERDCHVLYPFRMNDDVRGPLVRAPASKKYTNERSEEDCMKIIMEASNPSQGNELFSKISDWSGL